MKSFFRMCLIGAAILLAGRSELAQAGYDNCNTYYSSRVVSSYEYGTYCGATGNGCVYCWDNDGGGYCWGPIGSEYCVKIDHQTY